MTGTSMSLPPSGVGLAAALAGQSIPGSLTVNGALGTSGLNQITAGGALQASIGNVEIATAGEGLRVKEGANAKQGVATLVAGTVTVADTSVTANSRIFLESQNPNGGTVGFLTVSARTAGTSFTILSSNAADTSIVAYEIFEPG
jgi:hypothetical protein